MINKKERLKLYKKITKDYLSGLKYSVIEKKYKVNHGYIQYALEKIGIKTNRIRSRPRLKYGLKAPTRKKSKKNYKYPLFPSKIEDNNPVLIDDLDIMERMDETDGIDDFLP